jgi:hypothetical protein
MAQQQPSPESVQPKPLDPDEIVHTPTKHRARWIMGILLVVLILTTFTVGDEITGLLTGKGRNAPYARWNRPGVGEQAITGQEWQSSMRSLSTLFNAIGMKLQESEMKSRVAETLLVAALAEDAGVAVTDKELGEVIIARFGSAQNYHLMLPNFRVTAKEFEATLRQRLLVERYMALMSRAWNTPDIADVEKSWKTQHQEYAFDYVMLPIDSMMEQAKQAPITDEELHTYFDGLPQPKKDSYKTKEKIACDVAGMPYTGASSDALFAKYPKPADEAAIEAEARSYHDGFGFQRFEGKPYEEVKDQARAEALLYGALKAWLADVRTRQDQGQTIDLQAETAALGLSLQRMPAPLEQSEWIATKPAEWMGTQTASLIFGNATDAVAGKFYPNVIVDERGFTVVQLTTKQEPVMPAFETLAPTLRDELWKKRAKDFAIVRLESLRDQFGTRPPTPAQGEPPAPPFLPEVEEAKFYDAARAAGLEAKLRDFKERMPPPGGEAPAPIDLFARTQPALYSAKAGTVPAAAADFEGKNAFLVRVRGGRDPDPSRMKANEFANVTMGLQQSAESEFRAKAFSLNALQARYGLVFNEPKNDGG